MPYALHSIYSVDLCQETVIGAARVSAHASLFVLAVLSTGIMTLAHTTRQHLVLPILTRSFVYTVSVRLPALRPFGNMSRIDNNST